MKFQIIFLFLLLLPLASAHVGYVLEDKTVNENAGRDFSFLSEALTPFNILLTIVTILVLILAYVYLPRNKFFKAELEYLEKGVKEYKIFIPWIARLGLGIALIGAGTQGALITPLLTATGSLATIQIACGFLILAGFFLIPATIVSIVLYLIAIATDFYAVGNLDFLGLALAVLVIEYGKPGIDDLIGMPFVVSLTRFEKYTSLILRSGIGIAMIFLAVYEKILNPRLSELVVQNYNLTNAIPVSAQMWVLSAGIIELAVGLALLFGIKTRLTSVIAFIVLSASFFYFKEAVYSHITLFATLSAIFILGNEQLKLRIRTPDQRKKVLQI